MCLLGTMNPEEGELRPQLLDRFGLYVEARGEQDPRLRKLILKNRIEYERQPEKLIHRYLAETEVLQHLIRTARQRLPRIRVTPNAMKLATQMALDAGCFSLRGELTLLQAARAIAALDDRTALNVSDLEKAAAMALPHRRQFDTISGKDRREAQGERPREEGEQRKHREGKQKEEMGVRENGTRNQQEESMQPEDTSRSPVPKDQEELPDRVDLPKELFETGRWLQSKRRRTVIRKGKGRRTSVRTTERRGRYVRSRIPRSGEPLDIAVDATLRTAAPFQVRRRLEHQEEAGPGEPLPAVLVRREDIRVKQREKKVGNTIVFAVDASGSMGVNRRMAQVKGAVLSLLADAYQKRDQVGLVVFRRDEAQVLLPVTRSVELAQRALEEIPTGGKTPLAQGLALARHTILVQKRKERDTLPVLVLISDGRANVGTSSISPLEEAMEEARIIADHRIPAVVVNTEQGLLKLGLAETLAEIMEAPVFTMEELASGKLWKEL